MLKEAKRYLQERLEDAHLTGEFKTSMPSRQPSGRKVFIVHGHDIGASNTIARFIKNLGLEPVILREQPNQSRALIEKFEALSADVVFAVVVMTPGDVPCSVEKGEAGMVGLRG